MIPTTRLLFNLRQTTLEYVYLVRRGRFRSPDKDGDHIIQSAIVKNPMLHANVTALFSINRSYCRLKFHVAVMGIFALLANLNLHSRSLYVIVRPSVRPSVCLSVTFVHPTQAIEIFGNISMPFGALAIY